MCLEVMMMRFIDKEVCREINEHNMLEDLLDGALGHNCSKS